jgi:copper homeostasis protein
MTHRQPSHTDRRMPPRKDFAATLHPTKPKYKPPTPMPIQLEICTASAEDCALAQQGGADRVELNCALMLGGLTPSLGTVREARAVTRLPIIAMIRPRAGGFCYSASEFNVMQRDVELVLAERVSGIAFGILTQEGSVDIQRCQSLIKLATGREVVFHRAFDVTPNPLLALDQLVDLGVTRIMTSGQEASAYNGARNIAHYIKHAAGRIGILPGGGINRFTVADVVSRTGCDQVHASLTATHKDPSVVARPQVFFGGALRPPEDEFASTDPGAVAALRLALTGK